MNTIVNPRRLLKRARVLAAYSLFAIGPGQSAWADTLYTYTGNQFQSWTGGTCLGQCSLTVVLYSNPLPSNFSASNPVDSIRLDLGRILITDGDLTLTAQNAGADFLAVCSTDSQGLPTAWDIWIDLVPQNSIGLETANACDFGYPFAGAFDHAERGDFDSITYRAANNDEPGHWSVPEPSGMILLATGLAAVLGMGRRKWLA
jgi:hypothetical protein